MLFPRSHGRIRPFRPALECLEARCLLTFNEFPIPTSFPFPQGITAGPDGNLWFLEAAQQKIGQITPDGIITEFPILGPFRGLYDITTGPDGSFWITEPGGEGGNKIGQISAGGGSFTEFPIPTPDSNPHGITFGPDGNVWFIEEYANQIGMLDLVDGTDTITEYPIPTPGSFPEEIAAGPDGNLWFTEKEGNNIGRITPGGSITEFPVTSQRSFPMAITAGPDGNLWFTEYLGNNIGRITPNGTDEEIQGSITEFHLTGPRSVDPNFITAGPDGNVWFTEDSAVPNGNQIGQITPDGSSINEWPVPTGPNSKPMEITAGPDGNLWFTEYYGQQIGQFINDGGAPSGRGPRAPLLARTLILASPHREQRQPDRAAVEPLFAGSHSMQADPAETRPVAKADTPAYGPVHHKADSAEWSEASEAMDFIGVA